MIIRLFMIRYHTTRVGNLRYIEYIDMKMVDLIHPLLIVRQILASFLFSAADSSLLGGVRSMQVAMLPSDLPDTFCKRSSIVLGR
jgi:hypothetical protein